MSYKPETLAKYALTARQLLESWKVLCNEKQSEVKVSFSYGNRKIGKSLNISLLPIMTCARCGECSGICYDIKACLQYFNVINARAKNTAIMQANMKLYFEQIWAKMQRRRTNKYMRFHVGGDIPNSEYFAYMIETAKRFPDFTIWTYTKNYEVVNSWIAENGKENIPGNMTIMFSEWRGIPMNNPYGMPEFRVVFKDDEYKPDPNKVWYCPGNCDICKALHRGCLAGETTYCNEH